MRQLRWSKITQPDEETKEYLVYVTGATFNGVIYSYYFHPIQSLFYHEELHQYGGPVYWSVANPSGV